jgi:hypothetical protein
MDLEKAEFSTRDLTKYKVLRSRGESKSYIVADVPGFLKLNQETIRSVSGLMTPGNCTHSVNGFRSTFK